ncbi:MAG: TolC family protein [Burkholderiaceae bacterium]|nr:TolC family protein [Burkholderiaceae bacterium]
MSRIARPPGTGPRSRPAAVLLLAAALLGGCASVDPEQAVGPLRDRLTGHGLPALQAWPDASAPTPQTAARIDALLAAPLSMDGAVELALLQHRGLQARLAELGIGQAELAQVARLPNPGFRYSRVRGADHVEVELGLHVGLGRLLLMPLAREMAQAQLARAQAEAALQVVEQVAQVRRAWVEAVAAREWRAWQRDVVEAARAGAELARRMGRSGNFNALAVAREEAFEAEAELGLARAEQQVLVTQERLVRAVGAWGPQLRHGSGDEPAGLPLPARLPDLPGQPADTPDLEARAIAQRLDLLQARDAVERSARQLGLTRRLRFVDAVEFGVERSRSSDGERSRGWEVGLELPLFDFGDARVARAEQQLRQLQHQATQRAIEARSEVRETWGRWRHSWDIARHLQTRVLPLAQRIGDEQLLRYNGMLIGVFELLADTRSRIATVQATLAARRDFWLAEADLQAALLGRPGLSATPSLEAPAAAPSGGAAH